MTKPTPLYHQVEMEAEREIEPPDRECYTSAKKSPDEKRFHSLEEHAVMQKFYARPDLVAQRYGFKHFLDILRDHMERHPRIEKSPSIGRRSAKY